MNFGRKFRIASTVLALTTVTTVAPASAALPAAAPAADGASPAPVTLITGDRVHLPRAGSRPVTLIEPAAGRERIGFLSQVAGGRHYVIPTDALRMLGGGRLDHRLFDVTLLTGSGYDDARRATLPPETGPVAAGRQVGSHDLTLNVNGLDGAPTGSYLIMVFGLDDPTIAVPFDPDGSVTVRLPAGRYAVTNIVGLDQEGVRFAFLPYPSLSLTADTTIGVDARAGRPVSVVPPDPSASLATGDVSYLVNQGSGFSTSFTFSDLANVTVAHLGPALPRQELTAEVGTQWLTPGGQFYGLGFYQHGTVPTGFSRVVRREDVARVDAEFGTSGPPAPGRHGVRFAFPFPVEGQPPGTVAQFSDVPLPGRRTEFYNGDGVAWQTGLLQRSGAGDLEAELDSSVDVYQPGRAYRSRFNHGMFGPSFRPKLGLPWAHRAGDVLDFILPLFGDAAGHAGVSAVESASTQLFRDGALVGEFPQAGNGFFEVGPEVADYRLRTAATRPGIFDVTTAISAEWTFRSGHVDGAAPLPLSAVRFAPRLDATNTAPAGTLDLVPVTLQEQSGELARPRRLSVDVSYDGGRTWRPAEVLLGLAVLLHHPPGATSVSLRAAAADRHGNTVRQTIIRAYKLSSGQPGPRG